MSQSNGSKPMADAAGIPALILAGGLGARLRPRVPDRPKALAPVRERPFLGHQLDWLSAQGVTRVVIAVHHLAEQIIAFADEHRGNPLELSIVREIKPLGTGGAVANAFRELAAEGDWLVVNGDTHFGFSLAPALAQHRERSADVTMVVADVADAVRYGTVLLDGETIIGFQAADGDRRPGTVSCGAYVIDPRVVKDVPEGRFSLEDDLFPDLARRGVMRAHTVAAEGAFTDIGTPESYDAFCFRQ